ncbi:proteoglycan 3-like [Pogoniulus pusillus]|uniref:proteoglycan 3-like n=1 Tax=Pogoniulus pusillus TaxID=488313 RepID=UPI0030B929D3
MRGWGGTGCPGFANLDKAEPLKRGVQCPLANETRVFRISDPETGATCRYAAVPSSHTFSSAQQVCTSCFGGQLASIHNYHTNAEMQFWGGIEIKDTEFWIGGVIDYQNQAVNCHWADGSSWNYAHWQQGYPQHSGHACATFCVTDGLWRSASCAQQMPFVCEF